MATQEFSTRNETASAGGGPYPVAQVSSRGEAIQRVLDALLERVERAASGTAIVGRQPTERTLQRREPVVFEGIELALGDIEARVGFEAIEQCARVLREGIRLVEILRKLHETASEIGGSRRMAERVRRGCTKGRHLIDAGPTT